jgi:hypothetical protein
LKGRIKVLEQIVIISCPRECIRTTLSKIQAEDLPIIVVMDSTEDYLPDIIMPNIKKMLREPYPEEPSTYVKSNNNYMRCLELAAGKNTLILEDDVELQLNWREDMERCIGYVEKACSEYVLSIGEHGFPICEVWRGPPQLDLGLVREVLPQPQTNGAVLVQGRTHGRYFPSAIRMREILNYFRNYPYDKYHVGYDIVLDIGLHLMGIKLFVTQYPLLHCVEVESVIGYEVRSR